MVAQHQDGVAGSLSAAAARELCTWFARAGRSFPWRTERDPLWILAAEVLLRKTRAPNAADVYLALRSRFPTAHHVANARLEDLRALIAPAGLPSRASTIQQAAQLSVQGQDLTDSSVLDRIDGVGDYIKAAVRTMSGRSPEPMVDGGVSRVVGRLTGQTTSAPLTSYEARLRRARAQLTPLLRTAEQTSAPPRQLSLALLDLGALVCKPRPRCDLCPITKHCLTFAGRLSTQTIEQKL